MKRKLLFILSFAFLLSFQTLVQADEVSADSKIVEVTLYPSGALITRAVSLKLSAGEHTVIFSDIKPNIDENSLHVSTEAEKRIKLFGAQVSKEFLEETPSERINELKAKIESLEDERRRQGDLKKILAEEKKFLNSIHFFFNRKIPEELVVKTPSPEDLRGIFVFLDEKLTESYSKNMDADLKIRDLNKKMDVLRRELSQISGYARKIKRSIKVDIEVLKTGVFDLFVSYMVRGASWQPIYDARANFQKQKVELISYGIVRQTTGVDWNDVQISLSTAKPAIGGRMPFVSPWILRPYQPPVLHEGRRKFKRGMLQKEAFNIEELDTTTRGEADLPTGKEAPVSYSQALEKGTAVTYKLSRKATVISDGSEHKMPIASQMLKGDFKYSTYPRKSAFAYLGSRVTNADDLQLLAGRVNIFLEGDFVGVSSIDNVGPGEKFDLYLGIDENVKVERKRIERKIDETLIGGIPSRNRRSTITNKLVIENYKSKSIIVNLFEAMPISEGDKIKIKVLKVSVKPKEKDWKDRKGIWFWEIRLKPKEKKEITYTFTVEHPRKMQVQGL